MLRPADDPMRAALTLCGFALALVSLACSGSAGHEAAGSFEGETLRIVVGVSPGGGYDLQARLTAKYLGRHLPGHPAVVVEHLPGAGGLVAGQFLSRRAPRDGSTLGFLSQAVALHELLRQEGSGRLDLTLLGGPGPLEPVCGFSPRSGIASLDDWRRAPVVPRLGATGPGSPSYAVARVLNAALGLPIRLVAGYDGSAQVWLALESGEVEGTCMSWDSLKLHASAHDLSLVVRATVRDEPDLAGVPQARDIAPDPDARRLLESGVYAPSALGRFYALPPGVPEGRVAQLRAGLDRTLADPDLLREAKRAGMPIFPTTAEELENAVTALTASRESFARLKILLTPGT